MVALFTKCDYELSDSEPVQSLRFCFKLVHEPEAEPKRSLRKNN